MQEIFSLVMMTLAAVLALAVAIYYRPTQVVKPPTNSAASAPLDATPPPSPRPSAIPAAPWAVRSVGPPPSPAPPPTASEDNTESDYIPGRW